jgi:hypothetical protein
VTHLRLYCNFHYFCRGHVVIFLFLLILPMMSKVYSNEVFFSWHLPWYPQALSQSLPIPNVTTFTQALSQSLPIPNVTLPSPRLYHSHYLSLMSLYLNPGGRVTLGIGNDCDKAYVKVEWH